MAKKLFSTKEIAELSQSPYVAKVTPGQITYTPEFKRTAYEKHCSGIPMREIFIEYGIDPDMLGKIRVWTFCQSLREKASRDEGFTDLRAQNSRKPSKETREHTLAARVEHLEHELAYTRQEVEFLKKFTRQIWRRGSYGNPSSARSKIRPDS